MDVKRRKALGCMLCIPWREVDIDPPLIVQELTVEVKLLDAPVGNFCFPLQFGRLLEMRRHKERVLLTDAVVDAVLTERIYYPLPVNDQFIFDPCWAANLSRLIKNSRLPQRGHGSRGPLVKFSTDGYLLRCGIII